MGFSGDRRVDLKNLEKQAKIVVGLFDSGGVKRAAFGRETPHQGGPGGEKQIFARQDNR